MKSLAILLATALAFSTMPEKPCEPQNYTVDGHFEYVRDAGIDTMMMFIPSEEGSHDYYMATSDHFGMPIADADHMYRVTVDAGEERNCPLPFPTHQCDEMGYCYYHDNKIVYVKPLY